MRRQREAEAQAVALKAISSAEAEAAFKQAEKLRTQAQAEMEALKLRADGERAKESAAGLAEAEVLTAKAEAAMREAEAVRAKGLAEAESQKAKAEALAAFEGVAQRVELLRLQLDAQVRIETARAQSLAQAMSSMNIKLIGDPQSAASLLRLVTLADGMGEVIKATPLPVREIGQQLINQATGDKKGAGLLKMNESDEPSGGLAELGKLVPEVMRLADKTLDVNKLKGRSVSQVLDELHQKAGADDQPTIEKAQQALAQLPVLNDLPFDDLYLRATVK